MISDHRIIGFHSGLLPFIPIFVTASIVFYTITEVLISFLLFVNFQGYELFEEAVENEKLEKFLKIN